MSLTDDWNAGKLKSGKSFFIKFKNGEIEIAKLQHNDTFEYYDLFGTCTVLASGFDKIEVLAPCDYEELYRLKEELKSKDQTAAKAVEIAQLASNENLELRQLLSECKEYLSDVEEYKVKNADEAYLLLTRINEVMK